MTNLHLQFAETQQWRARTRGNEFQKEAALLWGKFSQNLHQLDDGGAGCSAALVFSVCSKVFNVPVARVLAGDNRLRAQKITLHSSSQRREKGESTCISSGLNMRNISLGTT